MDTGVLMLPLLKNAWLPHDARSASLLQRVRHTQPAAAQLGPSDGCPLVRLNNAGRVCGFSAGC